MTPEKTKTDEKRAHQLPMWMWLALAAIVVFFYFFGLTIPFVGPDEARYAQVGREMFERGDWITPTLGGFHWFEKPALLYWLEIVSYKIFGVTEFAARLGPALFGLGTVVSLWVLGRQIATETRKIGTSTSGDDTALGSRASSLSSSVPSVANDFPNWLALIAASTLGIMVFARGASFDIIITFPVTAALVSFFIFDQSRTATFKDRYLPLILFYVFAGIAILAKGLIGVVFPFAIVGAFYLFSRRLPGRVFLMSLLWGGLLAVAIAAVWYWPMYRQHGFEFIDEFFIQHHFQRFTSNKYQHPQPFYFFFWVLPLMTLPWLPFFLAAIWRLAKGMFTRVGAETQSQARLPFSSSPLLLFSLAWLIVPLVFFSFSGSKLPGYVLPSVPAAVILTALFMSARIQRSTIWRNAAVSLAVATFVVTGFLITFVVPGFAEADSVKALINAANERGYASSPVLTLHTISYNAEFYAAGRLLRDEHGRQVRMSGVNEVIAELNTGTTTTVLVLVPLEYLPQLMSDTRVTSAVVRENGELAIAAVSLRVP